MNKISSDPAALIRLASSLPAGDRTRKAILSSLMSGTDPSKTEPQVRKELLQEFKKLGFILTSRGLSESSYKVQIGNRELGSQFSSPNGFHESRLTLSFQGSSDTTPIGFTGLQSFREAFKKQSTRMDSKYSDNVIGDSGKATPYSRGPTVSDPKKITRAFLQSLHSDCGSKYARRLEQVVTLLIGEGFKFTEKKIETIASGDQDEVSLLLKRYKSGRMLQSLLVSIFEDQV